MNGHAPPATPPLTLRRANVFRKRSEWQHEDFDRLGLRAMRRARLSGQRTSPQGELVLRRQLYPHQPQGYGHGSTLEEARATFRKGICGLESGERQVNINTGLVWSAIRRLTDGAGDRFRIQRNTATATAASVFLAGLGANRTAGVSEGFRPYPS
jgi:hypothetical protein